MKKELVKPAKGKTLHHIENKQVQMVVVPTLVEAIATDDT